MYKDDWLAVCQASVHRMDRDRLMCAMVAPQHQRAGLIVLLAFNLEIATIPEIVSEPMLGQVRLQWWRDMVAGLYAGKTLDNPLAIGLGQVIEGAGLSKDLFDQYLDARAFDLDGAAPATLKALENYAEGTAGTLHELMAQVLGLGALPLQQQDRVRSAVRHGGVAWALSGLLAARAFHRGQGRSYMPADLQEVQQADAVMQAADAHIKQARMARWEVPKSMLPVMLPVTLAAYNLKKLTAKNGPKSGIGKLIGFYAMLLRRRY